VKAIKKANCYFSTEIRKTFSEIETWAGSKICYPK